VLAVTWLEAMTLASLAAVIAVVARSPMGAVVAVVVVRFVQTLLAAGLGAFTPEPDWKTLAIPAYSADLLRGFVSAPQHAGLETGPVGAALVVLLAWTATLAGGAILLFQRQDLTRE
jgi:ABC-2 type transport system permease protein